jgi:hypothetical protein
LKRKHLPNIVIGAEANSLMLQQVLPCNQAVKQLPLQLLHNAQVFLELLCMNILQAVRT